MWNSHDLVTNWLWNYRKGNGGPLSFPLDLLSSIHQFREQRLGQILMGQVKGLIHMQVCFRVSVWHPGGGCLKE